MTDVVCPHCNAPSGVMCTTPQGAERDDHSARTKANAVLHSAGWTEPDRAGDRCGSAALGLRVFGWQGARLECPAANNGSRTTREIVAAKSMAAAARAAGFKHPRQLFNLCETGNDTELAIALGSPGVVFWAPYDESLRSGATRWTAAPKAEDS